MSKRPFIVFGIFAAICVIAIPLYALGKEGAEGAAPVEVESSDVDSKELFAVNCGDCHTLAAGGTDGIVGPNLDELLVTSGSNAPEQYEGIYSRVIQAIDCGPGGRMPADILRGSQAQEAAAFVAAYAGQIGGGPTVDLDEAERAEPGPCPPVDAAAETG